MIRKIIRINEEKCNGCGLCVNACMEGALALVDGKAKLVREDYCDGLGNCLPACPEDAISFEEREAAPFEKEAVEQHQKEQKQREIAKSTLACGCSGSSVRSLPAQKTEIKEKIDGVALRQWPVQIKLLPTTAKFYQNADILIAADCCAYAYGSFHQDFIQGKIALVGCPKLDDIDYSKKLTDIFTNNDINSVTLTRMEVPCCGGMAKAVKTAIINSSKQLPLTVYTISAEGQIIAKEEL